MRFACCHLVTLRACVLLRKVSVGMSFEWKTSDACGKTCNVPVLFLTRFTSSKQRKPVDIYIILSFRGFLVIWTQILEKVASGM